MKINDVYFIDYEQTTDTFTTNIYDDLGKNTMVIDRKTAANTKPYMYCNRMLEILKTNKSNPKVLVEALKRIYKLMQFNDQQIETRLPIIASVENKAVVDRVNIAALVESISQKLIAFFSEFNYTPSNRFVNTLFIVDKKVDYVRNYFALQDHSYASEIAEKVESLEFKEILRQINNVKAKIRPINTRLEIFFGDPGAGKTYTAESLTEKTILCSADTTPKDLMYVLDFEDGKPTFKPTLLWKAMEEGRVVCLDEINLLPYETLTFLQDFTDDKKTFNFAGYDITVHPNFKIYGTMNLFVQGVARPLPEPLVDRTCNIVEFKLDSKKLTDIFMNNIILEDEETATTDTTDTTANNA